MVEVQEDKVLKVHRVDKVSKALKEEELKVLREVLDSKGHKVHQDLIIVEVDKVLKELREVLKEPKELLVRVVLDNKVLKVLKELQDQGVDKVQ